MIIISGNIWTYATTHWVTIPTNIGYKSNGHNVMGNGLAYEAKSRFPMIAFLYGEWCQQKGANAPIYIYEPGKLVMFPTKPLDVVNPHLSWKHFSSLALVRKSAHQLANWAGETTQVVLPMVGCGLGCLDPKVVTEELKKLLPTDNFTLVTSKAR